MLRTERGAQSADLTEAVNTLEDAIRRIDREMRERLQGTFNQVNTNLQQMFPQLFGGGEARLILTGDEILDAGIQIMGGPGLMMSSEMQMYFRDSRVGTIGGGTSEILRNVIAKSMLS